MSDLQYSGDWKKHQLSSIINSVIDYRGRTPLKIGMNWSEVGEVLSLSANNVKQGYIDSYKDAHYGDDELYRKWMTRGRCEEGDIVFTMEAPLGNVAQIPDKKKYILSQRVVLLKTVKSKADSNFIAHLFRGDEFQRNLIKNSTGSTVSGIQYKKLNGFNVLIPGIEKQQKIAKILTTIDNCIEKTQALIDKYTVIKQGMMADLFTRGIDLSGTPDTNPNYGQLRPSYEQAPELYKKTELGWVPKDWEVVLLDDLTTKIVDGVHHTPNYVEHGIPFVTVKNLTASPGIDFSKLNYIDERTHRECYSRADPKPGDVLVTKDGTLGVCRIVKEGMPKFSIFVSVAMLRVTEKLTAEWLHFFFDSGVYLKQLGCLSAGTGLKHIHLEHFKKFKIALPSRLEQKVLNAKVSVVEINISTEKSLLSKINEQKKGLMQDLLTGRVQVN